MDKMNAAEFAKHIEEAFDWAIGGEHPGSVHQWDIFVQAVVQQAVMVKVVA